MNNVSKAIVTGGAGFIGSHIVDELLEKRIETFVVDDFSTGSMDNLSLHQNDRLLHVIRGDIKDIDSLLPGTGADVIFHEAAIASVPKSVEDPIFVHNVNVNYTLKVLEYCRRENVKRIVFASSASVYGFVKNPPAEEIMHCAPASPYGASKLAIEDYLNAYQSSYGLDAVILRYFNVFGPRQKTSSYSGVITIFINSLLQGKNPTIFGDGLQTRDFVHVRDIALANILAMESESASGNIFNVASGRVVSILELFDIIKRATDAKNVNPVFGKPKPGDLRVGSASIERVKRGLGFSARVTLEQGLDELVELIAKKYEIQKA